LPSVISHHLIPVPYVFLCCCHAADGPESVLIAPLHHRALITHNVLERKNLHIIYIL
jgi:hypothetical protein